MHFLVGVLPSESFLEKKVMSDKNCISCFSLLFDKMMHRFDFCLIIIASHPIDETQYEKQKENSIHRTAKLIQNRQFFSFIVFQHSSFYKQNVEMSRSVDIRRIERNSDWK